MNLGTFVVLAILIVIVAFVIKAMVKDKKSGKTCSGCSGSCSGCYGSCSANKIVDDIMKKEKK